MGAHIAHMDAQTFKYTHTHTLEIGYKELNINMED